MTQNGANAAVTTATRLRACDFRASNGIDRSRTVAQKYGRPLWTYSRGLQRVVIFYNALQTLSN